MSKIIYEVGEKYEHYDFMSVYLAVKIEYGDDVLKKLNQNGFEEFSKLTQKSAEKQKRNGSKIQVKYKTKAFKGCEKYLPKDKQLITRYASWWILSWVKYNDRVLNWINDHDKTPAVNNV